MMDVTGARLPYKGIGLSRLKTSSPSKAWRVAMGRGAFDMIKSVQMFTKLALSLLNRYRSAEAGLWIEST